MGIARKSRLIDIFTKKDYNDILSGISLTKKANELNVSRQTLTNFIVKHYGYVISPKEFKTRKITENDIISAKERYLSGEERVSEIAKDLGINRKSLSRELKKIGLTILPDGKKSVNDHYFSNINTKEKAYWLGFLFADGYNSGKEIEFCLKEKDKYAVEHFKKAIDSKHKINKKIIKLNQKSFIAYRISIKSTIMANDLIKLGCVPKKSLIIEFPAIDQHLHSHFIRGYFDGDGCIYKTKKEQIMISFCSGSNSFLVELSNILKSNNILVKKIKKDKRHNLYSFSISLKSTSLFLSFLYKDSTEETRLDRKYSFYKNCRPESTVAEDSEITNGELSEEA